MKKRPNYRLFSKKIENNPTTTVKIIGIRILSAIVPTIIQAISQSIARVNPITPIQPHKYSH